MDQAKRQRLLENALSILEDGNRLLAVPMDEFFDGNTDEQSIGVNLPRDKHIGLAGFRSTFEIIRQRPDVQAVFIELTEVPYPDDEEDADLWPTASVAFVVTSASLEEVAKWVSALHPRGIHDGWNLRGEVKPPLESTEMRADMRPVRVWLL